MSTKITFYGHSAFKIETEEKLTILIDPWLDNPLAKESPSDIRPNDLILLTHGHRDHLGSCIRLADSSGAEVVAIHEIQQYLFSKGLSKVTGMNIGGTYKTKGITIIMVPAIHSSSIQEGEKIIYGGEAAGFVLIFEDGMVIYHAGDTALFGDMALIRELYRPRIAMLPIGSHYVMGPREAAYAVRLLKPEMVVPIHYGTFPALTGTLDDFKKELENLSVNVQVMGLSAGEELILE